MRPEPLKAIARDYAFVGLFLAGFVVRFLLLQQKGTADMDQYIAWGQDALNETLAFSYHGIYFPVQYLVFALGIKISWWFDVSGFTAIKAINLAADTGTFLLLVVLLRRWRLPHRHALVYWITPYFLAIYWLGYIDAQIGFLVLLAIVILSYRPTLLGFALAGIPFGLAFLMKPQVVTLVGVLGLGWLLVLFARRRLRVGEALTSMRLGVPAMLVFAVLLFAGFSIYIGANGEPYGKGYGYVARTYTPGELERQSSGFTGNMLNVWFPVAYAYHDDGEPIYAVDEPAVLNKVGTALALLLLVAGVVLVLARSGGLDLARMVLLLFLVGAAVVPMTATHAHENHLFLAALLCVPVLAALRDRWLMILFQAILLVQFLNLVGRYRLGLNSLSEDLLGWLDWYTDGVSLVASFAMLALVVAFAIRLARLPFHAVRSP